MVTTLNFNASSSQFKSEEINLQRSKVVYLSEAILDDPSNNYCQALLTATLQRLERLLTA